MKVRVDEEVCQGHGRCHAAAPELFILDDLGYCRIGEVDVPPELEGKARMGVLGCPEQAITVDDR